jgi:hypothetical protein
MPDNDLPATTDKPLLQTPNERVISIRLPDELIGQADDAAGRLMLKRADIIRLGMERGIPLLIAQLTGAPTEEVAP